MRKLICLLMVCCAALPLAAQRRGRVVLTPPSERNRFAWEYDADLQYIFDNREFSISDDEFVPSGTFHSVVFAPTVGFSIQQSPTVQHRLTAGIELAHDMGTRNWADLPREPLIYYDVHVQARKGSFEGLAGIFPRRFMEENYSEAFFSGLYRNTDRNIEGMLLKWQAPRFRTELTFDWMGKYGPGSRERFQILSAGRMQATPWLSLGWTGSFYHFACSYEVNDVVDNHLLNPWVKADFSRRTEWQELSVQAGALAGYQRIRERSDKPTIPVGGEFKLVARRWNVALQNTTYVGADQMPFRRTIAPEGGYYGTALYFGTPCYKDFFDLIEAAWTPQLTHYLSMRLAVRFYFGKYGFMGWQQQFSVRFSLDALRHRDIRSGRCL